MHISGWLPSLLRLKALRSCQWMRLRRYIHIAMSQHITQWGKGSFDVQLRRHDVWISELVRFWFWKHFFIQEEKVQMHLRVQGHVICFSGLKCWWLQLWAQNTSASLCAERYLQPLVSMFILHGNSDFRGDDSYLISSPVIFTNHPCCTSAHCK